MRLQGNEHPVAVGADEVKGIGKLHTRPNRPSAGSVPGSVDILTGESPTRQGQCDHPGQQRNDDARHLGEVGEVQVDPRPVDDD